MRPRLVEGLRWLWRGPSTLQLGVDPTRAIVLDGVDPPLAALLRQCDGGLTLEELVAAGRQAGVAPADVIHVVDRLTQAGIVDDGATRAAGTAGTAGAAGAAGRRVSRPGSRMLDPERRALTLIQPDQAGGSVRLGRRARARIEVHGAGRVGTTVALLLAAGGVGGLRVVDDRVVTPAELAPAGADSECLGLPRPLAVRDRVERLGLSTAVEVARTSDRPPADWHPDLVVVAPDGGRRPALLRELAERDVAHLPVETRETSAVVGPFTVPGSTCCPHCLDLYRAERDPAWPAVAAQLDVEDPTGVEVLVATAAGLLAAAQALTFLDGLRPDALDATLEVSLPTLRWRRRSWTAHPACGCQLQQAAG